MSWYQIILHALALEGLCLTAAIAVHMWRHPVKHQADEMYADPDEMFCTDIQWTPDQLAAASVRLHTVHYDPPFYDWIIVK